MASRKFSFATALISSLVLGGTMPALAQDGVDPDERPVYLEADTVNDLTGGEGYLARGNVRVRQGDRTLFADELEYRPADSQIIARGNVIFFGQGEHAQHADEMVFDTALNTGLALGFAAMLENQGRVAAATAVRRADGSLQANDAYYTACPMCETGDGEPTWRIRASEVVRDVDNQMVYYKDAQIEMMGVPVFYAPAFSHADPSSERRSGLLFPGFGVSSRLGVSYQQPYYWAISPSQDLIIAPRVMSNVNPLLYGEYRKRFWSGQLEFEGSYTNEQDIDGDGNKFGESHNRWHIFGGGRFDITDDWRWGFTVQGASDELNLRRYDFSEQDKDRGAPLNTTNRRLINQLYVENRGERQYALLAGATYQSLRSQRDDATIPDIAPMFEFQRNLIEDRNWGRVTFSSSSANLRRSSGQDYTRASAGLDWRTRYVSSTGLVVEPYALARHDSYWFDDVEQPDGTLIDTDATRSVGLAGAEFSYPLYRPGETVDWILEPVVSAVISSEDGNNAEILNEDSLSVDLDESIIFAPIRSPGHDIWEEGQRIAWGLRATAQWGSSSAARVFVGQSHRLDGDAVFSEASGLFEDNSDYVVAGSLSLDQFELDIQTRLNEDDFDLDRISVTTSYTSDAFYGSLRYTDVSDDSLPGEKNQELQASFGVRLTEHWDFIGDIRQDLDADETRRSNLGFGYEDDCTQLQILYQREANRIAGLGDSESIQVRIALFTLGSLSED